MKILNMSRDEFGMVEQHIGTIAWVIVIGLLSWNVVTTNNLQIAVAQMTVKVGQIESNRSSTNTMSRLIDSRLDSLERRADKCDYSHANGNP